MDDNDINIPMPEMPSAGESFGGNALSDAEDDSDIVIQIDDEGNVIVDLNPEEEKKPISDDFDSNLAEDLDEDELKTISSNLLEGIDADITSRKTWVDNLKESMTQLGLEREVRSGLDLDTVAKCRHPILLEAVLDFWANFTAEFLPAEGPVKIKIDDDNDPAANDEADDLEQDLNHYLTDVATEYYPDTSRAGLRIALTGGIVKKVYHDAVRERPVSEAVYLDNLIVSNDITDLDNANRVTHEMMYLPQQVKEMQLAGVWRDVDLGSAQGDYSEIKHKVGQIEGVDVNSMRDDDKQHVIYECHTRMIISGDKKARETLPCPYKITIDKNSREVLAVYRLWKDGDKNYKKKQQFVPWFYAPGLGWYPMGIGQILMNDVTTLTALWREMVDAGMFANFPGFLYLDSLGRQDTNRFRLPPGGGQPIKAPPGVAIQQAIMPVPYKDVSPTLLALAQKIEDGAKAKAMAAKVPVGEGRADIPVGTLVMMVEQASKMMQAVHKGLHTAQKREFELLKELFVETPDALTKFNNDPNQKTWTSEQLANHNLSPASDPNTPSHIHRLMQNMALEQLAEKAPQLFDLNKVAKRLLKTMRVANVDELFAPPAPPAAAMPPPDPMAQMKMAEIQQKEQDSQRKAASELVHSQNEQRKQQMQAQLDAAQIQSKERIAQTDAHIEGLRLQMEEARSRREESMKETHNLREHTSNYISGMQNNLAKQENNQ